jgi:hypothetical protein
MNTPKSAEKLSRTVVRTGHQNSTVPDSSRTAGTVATKGPKNPENKRNMTVPDHTDSSTARVPEGNCPRPRRSIAGTVARTPDRDTKCTHFWVEPGPGGNLYCCDCGAPAGSPK